MTTLRVTCVGLLFGQTINNTVHFSAGAGFTPNDYPTIGANIYTNFLMHIRNTQSVDMTWYRIEIRNISDPTQAAYNHTFQPLGGAHAPAFTAAFAAIIYSLRTGNAGRSARGRIYVVAPRYAIGNNSLPNAQNITDAQTAAAAIMAAYGPNGSQTPALQLGVYSRTQQAWRNVTNIIIQNRFGIQRRRNIGVGI